jgi:hypothetical protein
MASYQIDLLRTVAADGLSVLGLGGYVQAPDASYLFLGERPGSDWHIHGWLTIRPTTLRHGHRLRLTVHKRRWRRRDTNDTVHSRPPDDLGRRYDALIIALSLFTWLDAAVGLHRYDAVFADLDDRPARRTVQRWLRRGLPRALELQQAVRHTLIDRMEPRPVESLFPAGVPPPVGAQRRWRDPLAYQLHRGLAILFGAAISLQEPGSLLLAEARRRAATDIA